MTHSTKFRSLVLGAAILSAGLAVQAQAQPAQRPAAEARMAGQGGKAMRDPAEMAARMTERLKTMLQLRPEQEPALNAYVAAMKPPEGARQAMRGQRQEMAKLTTPERLERMKAMMARRQAEFDKRAAATLRFYAQLTPTQQKAFDAMGPMHHGGGRHMGGQRMGQGRG
ncbi:MAG: Spy/CpxP family protein refolding chaperone [Phenylobacterium sp.]|uniref:Spy/CpxP family protein refolding chaperone n=1 Tax=Phenylobacterium sp. TaxID=1871053 RepID=UPI00391BE329